MNWEIEFLQEFGVVQITTSGPITIAPLKQMTVEALAEGTKQGSSKSLIDCRNARSALKSTETAELSKILQDLGVKKDHKIAIVYSPGFDWKNDFRLFAGRAFIAGLNLQLFTDPESALDWLIDRPKK